MDDREREEETTQPSSGQGKELNIIDLVMRLWSSRKKVAYWAAAGAVIGLIIAFSIPREYTVTVKLIPESADTKGSGGLGTLAALAGVNVTNAGGGDAVNPSLYPDIVSSIPFNVELLGVELPTDIPGVDEITFSEFLSQYTKHPWWDFLFGLPKKAVGAVVGIFTSSSEEPGDTLNAASDTINPFRLTRSQSGMVSLARKSISTGVDRKTNTVRISVTLQDPLAAASLADTVAQRLQDYVADYRTSKARHDVEYAKKINTKARDDYYEAQQRLAHYIDRNQGLAGRSALIEQERLQNEANLAYGLYNSTSQQLQLAEAKIQSDMPVFSVIEPATVPLVPVSPKKLVIFTGTIFLAIVFCCGYVLLQPFVSDYIKRNKFQR